MKKAVLFNAPLSAAIAQVGHTDSLVICDPGLPIPDGPMRIDLAVTNNIPRFLDVLRAMASELQIERIVIASEMASVSPAFEAEFQSAIISIGKEQGKSIPIEAVTHDELKRLSAYSRAVIRTGECTYYANAIIYCGVSF